MEKRTTLISIRLFSVTDTGDAMTSRRSCPRPLPQEVVENEILKGMGTQFDPAFAKIMIQVIEEDVNDELHEF